MNLFDYTLGNQGDQHKPLARMRPRNLDEIWVRSIFIQRLGLRLIEQDA